jgi:hypothetical protein
MGHLSSEMTDDSSVTIVYDIAPYCTSTLKTRRARHSFHAATTPTMDEAGRGEREVEGHDHDIDILLERISKV